MLCLQINNEDISFYETLLCLSHDPDSCTNHDPGLRHEPGRYVITIRLKCNRNVEYYLYFLNSTKTKKKFNVGADHT